VRMHFRFIVATLVAFACSDSSSPARVRITGFWSGTLDATGIGASVCPLDPAITEDNNGAVTGTALLDAPCATINMTVNGTNNTGGVADSVKLDFTSGLGNLTFNGKFDGSSEMTGLISGEGCVTCPASFTRDSTP